MLQPIHWVDLRGSIFLRTFKVWLTRSNSSDPVGARIISSSASVATARPVAAVNLESLALRFLPPQSDKDGVAPKLFASIVTVGTPRITVHKLRIELFFSY